jgi:hypothetical protein
MDWLDRECSPDVLILNAWHCHCWCLICTGSFVTIELVYHNRCLNFRDLYVWEPHVLNQPYTTLQGEFSLFSSVSIMTLLRVLSFDKTVSRICNVKLGLCLYVHAWIIDLTCQVLILTPVIVRNMLTSLTVTLETHAFVLSRPSPPMLIPWPGPQLTLCI